MAVFSIAKRDFTHCFPLFDRLCVLSFPPFFQYMHVHVKKLSQLHLIQFNFRDELKCVDQVDFLLTTWICQDAPKKKEDDESEEERAERLERAAREQSLEAEKHARNLYLQQLLDSNSMGYVRVCVCVCMDVCVCVYVCLCVCVRMMLFNQFCCT